MPVTSSSTDSKLVIKIGNRLNAAVRDEFRNSYEDSENYKEYVIDLQQTEFIDSSGLGLLLAFYGRTKLVDNSIKLQIINCSENVKNILRMSKFDKYFELL